MSRSLVELGQISKAGGPFDLTAYSQRRARRAGRRAERRAGRGHGLGRVGGNAAYDTVIGAGHGARQSVRGIMDDVARGAPAIANRTVDEAGKALVTHGSRLAGRTALYGGLGLAGGIGAGITLGELSRRGLRRVDQGKARNSSRRPVAKADWKNISQREIEARNGRRAKRQGKRTATMGAGGMGLAYLMDGGAGPIYVAGSAKEAFGRKSDWHPSAGVGRRLRAAGRSAATTPAMIPMRHRLSALAGLGGAAMVAGGAGHYAYGLGRERNAESRIRAMRKKRALERRPGLSQGN